MIKGKILLTNFLVLAAYMTLFAVTSGREAIIVSALAIALHTGLNFIFFIIYLGDHDKSTAFSYLLSTIMVVLIGYSSCWAVSSIAR